jgi:hypothetical protein
MVYVRNRSWSKGVEVIPFTAITWCNPDLTNLRIFGCLAYVHIESSQRPKFSPKAWQGIFVGYAFDSPAWIVYNPVTRRVLRTRIATFNEAWTPSPLSTSGEPTSLPTSPPKNFGDLPHFLTAFDNFEDAPFVPPTIVEVPPLPIIFSR